MVTTPPLLKKGQTIGVFAPSSWVDALDIEKSKQLLESKGYNVFIHPQTYERENQSAGTNLQKALAFQGLWMRKDIDVLWAAGGGNRCMHLLDSINFDKLKTLPPKALIGFSDVTALLNATSHHVDLITYHGPVFKNVHKYGQLEHLLSLLETGKASYPLTKANILTAGHAQARLIGGNLSLVQYLPNYVDEDYFEDSILILEDCNEELSRIDRMLLHLKKNDVFKKAKAIVFGEFSDIPESGKPFGYTLLDLIEEHTHGLDIPILYDMPFGHGKSLYTMPIGAKCVIDTNALTFTCGE